MARDTTDFRPIEGIDELVEHLAEGNKPRDKWRIGTEHEKFPFYIDGNAPVPYGGERGIRAILEGMQSKLGWDPIIDDGRIIGLVEPTGQGGAYGWIPTPLGAQRGADVAAAPCVPLRSGEHVRVDTAGGEADGATRV